ncbi:MAG: RES family NAD+ phosphorylase [Acidimicrobiales bacterium]|nr:RES family NAD+ phosphorylase [Acidimicrobiales bacterium]
MAPWAPGGGSAQLFGDLEAVRSGQQSGRWDNSRLYGALHLALSQAGAVAEVLGNHAEWTDELFDAPSTGLRRHLLTVELADAVVERLVDIDNPRFLTDRGLRPSEVAGRARTRTRTLAADLFSEGATGIRFWSYYRPEWTNVVLFVPPVHQRSVRVTDTEEMRLDLPCVAAASEMLCRVIRTS